MPWVRFLPRDIAIDVPAGTLIHEAAIRAGIHDLELPCGGEGTCGQCLVELADADNRVVLACRTHISDSLTVRVPEARNFAMRVVGESHFLVDEELLPDAGRLSPLYSVIWLDVPPASTEEHYSDWARVVRELCRIRGNAAVSAPPAALRKLAAAIREQDGKITLVVKERNTELCIVDVEPGHHSKPALGLAVDIGTTTVAAQVIDLNDGCVLATRTSYNLQIHRGSDVISRIDYARTETRLNELRQMILDTINGLIVEMGKTLAIEVREIQAAFVVGNTTMIHLFLGLPPRYIRESPYVPTVNPVPACSAQQAGLNIHPEAVVEFAPGVGSYVGGDITAGLLATDLPNKTDQVNLFLDIGTNGEIVIGNAEWMVCCACSAGPAFEGAGIKCGMRATEGAIERIELGSDPPSYEVIGGGKPAGICGSGLICLIGELFRTGMIDQSGRFRNDSRNFVVETAARTANGEDLVITESDVENLIRTKAAIYAACSLILKNVGLDWSAISRVYIAGGFGRYIQVADAILIGLLPDLPLGRFSYIGNSALTGAFMALLSREHRRKLMEIAARMTYLELSCDPQYMDSYIQAMFLPHTDLAQFPNVAKLMANQRRATS